MNKSSRTLIESLVLITLFSFQTVAADNVAIIGAKLNNTGNNLWSFNVTLRHADTGWDHYADGWRVVDSEGNVLGNRVLLHPHVDEQPFTRGLSRILIPAGTTTVYVEARDNVDGWTEKRLQVDLGLDR